MAFSPQKQREFALQVVSRLREAGHLALWAGGCVRDQLLGRTPKDFDVATNARPEQVRKLFGPRRTIPVGAAFGVMTVVGPPGAGQVEVTTFRRDAEYHDGRHPDAVFFSEPEEDAARRDFTINGLFFDPIADQVIDYVGGRDDLRAGIVRAIGDPRTRFAEDKLRMLRAIRFAATLDFQLDHDTLAAIRLMAPQLGEVSTERIAQELRLILIAEQRVHAVQLLFDSGLMAAILPEVAQMRGIPQHKLPQPGGDLFDHTLLVLSHLHEPGFELALATLLHDVGKPSTQRQINGRLTFHEHENVGAEIAERICARLRLSNRQRQHIEWLVRHHMYLGQARQMRWAKLQRMLTSPGIEDLLDLHEADALASTGEAGDIAYCREVLQMPPQELNPPALLTGHDLIRQGLKPGPDFQVLLEKVRDAQLEKQIRSKRDAIALVEQLLAQKRSVQEPSSGDPLDRRAAPPPDEPLDKPGPAT